MTGDDHNGGEQPDVTCLRVSGGPVTPEEAAALALALTAADPSAAHRPVPRPRWLHAARLEALGIAQVAQPGDLRTPERPIR